MGVSHPTRSMNARRDVTYTPRRAAGLSPGDSQQGITVIGHKPSGYTAAVTPIGACEGLPHVVQAHQAPWKVQAAG